MTIWMCFMLLLMIAMVTGVEFGNLGVEFVVLGVDLVDFGC